MHNTLTDHCKNKPTRNYILKMYKDTKLTNREFADSILNSVIKDESALLELCLLCLHCFYVPGTIVFYFFKGSELFLTSGGGGEPVF